MTDTNDDLDDIRAYLTRITSPVRGLDEVLSLLCAPLHALSLLPRTYEKYNTNSFRGAEVHSKNVSKRLPSIHSAFITHILPVWYENLVEEGHESLVLLLFSPNPSASPYAGVVALTAWTSLTSHHLQESSIRILSSLAKRCPIDQVYRVIFNRTSTLDPRKRIGAWEEFIRCVSSLPSKVSNWAGEDQSRDVPEYLEAGYYYQSMCTQTVGLVASIRSDNDNAIQNISTLITKLANLGLFSPTPKQALSPSQTSFFATTLSTFYNRLSEDEIYEQCDEQVAHPRTNVWPLVFRSLSRTHRTQVAVSLIINIDKVSDESALDDSEEIKKRIVRDAMLLRYVLGSFANTEGNEDGDLWDVVSSVMLAKFWDIFSARVFICWVANCGDVDIGVAKALETLLGKVLDLWSDATHVRHSILAQHKYVTSLLLLTLSALHSLSTGHIPSLHFNPLFINGISLYLSHLDPAVRRCGMLAAEVVASRAGKDLSFGGWDTSGEEGGWSTWARGIRSLVENDKKDWDVDRSRLFDDVPPSIPSHPADATYPEPDGGKPTSKPSSHVKVDSDDESLAGYDSDDDVPYSRTPSPTPSELEEIERDPTIHVGRKRVHPPVYLVDLGTMLRENFEIKGEGSNNKGGDGNAEEKAQAVKIALECAEDMIRRRRTFGAELDECAIDLAHALIGMRNNFELENFDEQRQKALNALVACAPRKAAPTIAQELFSNQYSVDQRYTMLNALALGARELAGLPVTDLDTTKEKDRSLFPSKMLPPVLHARYVDEEEAGATLALLTEDLDRRAVESGGAGREINAPRERRLHNNGASNRITDISNTRSSSQVFKSVQSPLTKPVVSFTSVAVESFIGPLMGRFWNFVRDEQTREVRSALSDSSELNTRYHPAGTGMVLSPLVLAHLVRTVTVLVHASRHSPLFMATVVPDALEMAVIVGTRPITNAEDADTKSREQEAFVLHSCLQLALITFDACVELDGGRILAMDHSTLVLGLEEWAMRVVQELEKGTKVGGGGGALEAKLGRVAAAVVVKIDEVVGKWRRVMVRLTGT